MLLLLFIYFALNSTVRCIDDNKTPIVEGELRAKELCEYLERMKCTKHVWLSEDGTAISSKVTFDPKTNQLVGVVLPVDEKTGYPISFTYIATNAETIKKHLMQEKSSILYLVMAQPLDENIPPFVLQMYGTNNKFDTHDVIRRWNSTKTELEKYVIMNQQCNFSFN